MYWIPVNKGLKRTKDVVLPYNVVEEFIEKSSHRVVMNFCGCRAAYDCKDFPVEVGCLMMGEDTKKIPKYFGKPVSKKEAKQQLKKAVDAGLPPVIGKARLDNFIFGIPDDGKLLTVCFCCQCCCIARVVDHLPDHEIEMHMPRLEGLEIWVDEKKCIGCGTCVDKCFVNAISMKGDKAEIAARCRGCGRCAIYCPQDAIRLKMNDPDFVEKAVRDIEGYVNVGK